MVSRSLSISAGALSLSLDGPPVMASPGFRGGLADREAQWIVGAGEGATHRGSRTPRREFPLPLHLSGTTDAIRSALDTLAAILTDTATLTMTLTDGEDVEDWDLEVVRTGGGSWDWSPSANSYIDQTITLTAGKPFWARRTAETITVANLAAATSVTVLGTAPAWSTWQVTGPCTSFTLASGGRSLTWSDVLAAAETVDVDMRAGTVKKAGTNVYGSLASVPKFWSLQPGSQTVTATMTGSDTGSGIVGTYYPRRELVY